MNFSLERDDSIRDEADFEYKNGVYAIIKNIIYVSTAENFWTKNRVDEINESLDKFDKILEIFKEEE